VHEDAGVDTHDVLVEQHHRLPPILFDIVLELYSILTIVINGGKAVVNIRTGEDETIFLAMAHNLLKYIFLCHVKR